MIRIGHAPDGIARVFPRRTAATPDDDMAFVGEPPLWVPAGIKAVHVSVAFTWDREEAVRLAVAWARIAPVTLGGPAYGQPSGEFTPGLYLKRGYTITSRGCPNRCWFCSVWRREGETVRELPIRDGWNVLDDNLLACSETHVDAVFAMLDRQPHPAQFTGGLEAARLTEHHVHLLASLRRKPKAVFFAYDTEDDYEPLRVAAARLANAGMLPDRGHRLRCYALIGYPKDTMAAAERRLQAVVRLGIMPFAMLWRDKDGRREDGDGGVRLALPDREGDHSSRAATESRQGGAGCGAGVQGRGGGAFQGQGDRYAASDGAGGHRGDAAADWK